jgi:predicted nucleic acid-binding protein
MKESDRPFVILIDTNAMSKLWLYVESCNTIEKDLDISIDDLKSEFKNQKNIKENYLDFEEVEKGYKLYSYLRNKIKSFNGNIEVWFSFLSEIELLNVFLEKVFDIELTRKGIPYIIRKKKLFRMQIEFNYEEKVAKNWEDIKEKLAQHDIEFNNSEKESDAIQDIKKIAKIVTRYVALGSVDLYIYALGIHLKANKIYTHDQELRGIINNIRNKCWRNVYDNIQKDLRTFIRSFREECETYFEMYRKEKEIDLPKGVP